MAEDKKEEFKRKLSGEFINWKEYALYQIHTVCEAEMREKEFCPESRYFYERDIESTKAMNLTEEQRDYVCEQYVEWLKEQGKL